MKDQGTNAAAGPDGNIWFAVPAVVAGAEKIGKITPSGAITEYPLPTHNSYLQGITTGPDGNVWFTEYEGNKIGRITPTGTITTFAKPKDDFYTPGLGYITAGPDGNIWYTGGTPGSPPRLGRFSPNQ